MTQPPTSPVHDMIRLVSAAEVAACLGYSGPNDSFRKFCASAQIRPVPGRVGWYDPRHIRDRLDKVQGIDAPTQDRPGASLSFVDLRRLRNGKV